MYRIGVTAYRNAEGGVKKVVPIYAKEEDMLAIDEETGKPFLEGINKAQTEMERFFEKLYKEQLEKEKMQKCVV